MMFSRRSGGWCVAAAVLAAGWAQFALALPSESNHGLLQAVPAVGLVAIDGVLGDDEWDRSGAMEVFGVRRNRDRYAATVHAMWNADALFLGIRWRDPTPLISNVDPFTDPQNGWMSDSFQARFTTDRPQVHLTAWYSSLKDASTIDIRYGDALATAGAIVKTQAGRSVSTPEGFEMAFRADSDSRGYVQEMRIPWPILFASGTAGAGTRFRFTGEFFWGGPAGTKWPAVTWSDPVNQQNPQRVVLYQNPGSWGDCVLLDRGRLPPPVADDEVDPLQGPVSIQFPVPTDATHFTLVIDDAEGGRVRNLAAHLPIADFTTKSVAGKRMVEVHWDGRSDGPWQADRGLFVGGLVPPGEYAARPVVHRGLSVVHAGSFYNPGTPPWPTADMTGDWGYDHSGPATVAAIGRDSAAAGRVFIGFSGGENGVGLIGLSAEGRKAWSWARHGVGATFVAADGTAVVAYATDVTGKAAIIRCDPQTGQILPVAASRPEIVVPTAAAGLSIRDGIVALAVPATDSVMLYDLASGESRGAITVAAPGSIAFQPGGGLVGVSGTGLFTADLAAGTARPLPLGGVVSPVAVAVDADGGLFVSDAADATVKVFQPAVAGARPVRTIGEPGGHRPGPWDPRRMQVPRGLAIEERADGTRLLWCAEGNAHPRRVSVWRPDGGFVRDYLGNTNYSGHGGFLSDDDPTKGLFVAGGAGLVFTLAPDGQGYELVELMGGWPDAVAGRGSLFGLGANPTGMLHFGNGVMFTSDASGREVEYYCEGCAAIAQVFVKRGERWVCVAALGSRGAVPAWPADLPAAPTADAVFSWSDLDGDGLQQPQEVTWFDPGRAGMFRGGWGYRPDRDLAWYFGGYAFKPVAFGPDGGPRYDAGKAERLPGQLGVDQEMQPGEIYKTRFGYLADVPDASGADPGTVIHGLHWLTGYDEQGRQRWRYPNYWLAVHGAMTAPMALPGVIMGALKVTGIVRLDEHDVIALRGNMGQEFLIRDDGIFLGELFTDQRMAPGSLPAEEPIVGVPINDTTLGGEPFNGWMQRQRDGRVRMTYGSTDVRIAEVRGLDRVDDLPAVKLELTPAAAAACSDFQPRRARPAGPLRITVPKGGPWPADMSLLAADDTVPGSAAIRAGSEEVGRAFLRHDDAGLHVAFAASDATPLANAGTVAELAFKTGDAASLFVAPLADYGPDAVAGVRVLMAPLAAGPVAVVYQPQGSGRAYAFESPVRTTTFGFVGSDPAVRPAAAATPGKGWVMTATLPWATLGVTPAAGLELRGDLGLLFSDETGTRTEQRVQWADRQTAVVNDVPSEAEFFPGRWGIFVLE